VTWPHWGDVPAWVGAVGTVGTFTYGFRLLARENDRAHRADEDTRRAQAVAISAAVETRTLESAHGARSSVKEVVMLNASLSPVYDVNVYITRSNGVTIGVLRVPVLLPGDRCEPLGEVMNPKRIGPLHAARIRPEPRFPVWTDVWFHDAAGHTWRRDHRGVLHDLQPTPERTLRQQLTRRTPEVPTADFPPVQERWSATDLDPPDPT